MAFEKINISQHTLTTDTILRFIEIEINLGIEKLTPLYSFERYPNKHAQNVIAQYLAEDKHLLKDDLIRAFNSLKFRKPSKEEMIQYFRYKNIGVSKVVKLTSSSPNTLQNYKDKYPNFTPVFPSWKNFYILLNRWEELKQNLNLFDEELIHMKNTYRPSTEQNTITEEIPELPKRIETLPTMNYFDARAKFNDPFNEEGMVKASIATYGELPRDFLDRIFNKEFDIIEVIPYIQDPSEQEKIKNLYNL